MIKMYRTSGFENEIIEKEFIEVSEKSVFWINEKTGKKHRELISSNFYIWHKSKEDAIEYLKNKWERQIKSAEYSISKAKQMLDELKSL